MTDRVRTIHVTLSHDIRDDDAEIIAEAIRALRHVSTARLGPDIYYESSIAREHAKRELRDKLYDLLLEDS